MLTSQFQYDLPDAAIARKPVEPRDSARLLVSRNDGEIIDSRVTKLAQYLRPGDLVIVNDTKVLPARIEVTRSSGGKGEVFLLNRIDKNVWNALVRPSAKITPFEVVLGAKEINGDQAKIEIGENIGDGQRIVRFVDIADDDVIAASGKAPLPPYLGDVDISLDRYQTMFADIEKSVAAPTAGLHFTDNLIASLKRKSIEINKVTLHVGLGTFRPIKAESIEDHQMHSEVYEVSETVMDNINKTRSEGGRIIAVGTTSLRTLESVALTGNLSGSTDLYCHGDFDFKVVDMLFTNFHQPSSSLLVLLDAFIGSRWRNLYEHALLDQYRFLSFGDAMLVGRRDVIS